MASEKRAEARRRKRAAAREQEQAERQRAALEAQQRAIQNRVQQVDGLGQHISGYQKGFSDGYFQCLADLKAGNVVGMVATQILAVHHDPTEQAKYVLGVVQRAMRPRNIELFKQGIDRATTKYLQEEGLLPKFDDPPPAKGEEAVRAAG